MDKEHNESIAIPATITFPESIFDLASDNDPTLKEGVFVGTAHPKPEVFVTAMTTPDGGLKVTFATPAQEETLFTELEATTVFTDRRNNDKYVVSTEVEKTSVKIPLSEFCRMAVYYNRYHHGHYEVVEPLTDRSGLRYFEALVKDNEIEVRGIGRMFERSEGSVRIATKLKAAPPYFVFKREIEADKFDNKETEVDLHFPDTAFTATIQGGKLLDVDFEGDDNDFSERYLPEEYREQCNLPIRVEFGGDVYVVTAKETEKEYEEDEAV